MAGSIGKGDASFGSSMDMELLLCSPNMNVLIDIIFALDRFVVLKISDFFGHRPMAASAERGDTDYLYFGSLLMKLL